MKRGKALLISILVISGASADSLGVPPLRSIRPAYMAGGAVHRFADLKDDVAQEVRDTTAFVKQQANTPGNRSRWLTALAGCGLVVLQLRRKHKSLPQRRIAPYG